MASVGVTPANAASASAALATAPIDTSAYLSSFPDARNAVAAASPAGLKTATLQPNAPIFRSLFQAGERSEPISPVVKELWGSSSSLTSVAPASSIAPATSVASATSALTQTPTVRAPQPLDLFSDRNGTFSG